jgi:DNA-3-methyladenine glycosylase
MRPLGLEFFDRPAPDVARALLGQRLESLIGGTRTGGRIVETEAYLGHDDPASHAFRGRRHAGNLSIYGPPGWWYVYRSYGIHWCLNLVTAPEGVGAAVLIRAIEPDLGLDQIQIRRGGRASDLLTNGPGKLTQALGIDRSLDGRPMAESPVLVLAGEPVPDRMVAVTPRVGISVGKERELRFVVAARGKQ